MGIRIVHGNYELTYSRNELTNQFTDMKLKGPCNSDHDNCMSHTYNLSIADFLTIYSRMTNLSDDTEKYLNKFSKKLQKKPYTGEPYDVNHNTILLAGG